MTISTNQFKNGIHIEVDGTIFKIVEFQHVKPGKGGAFVRTKLKRVSDGAVIDKTFRAGEKFRPIRTETRKMQFLYADGTDAHLMDTESYEQISRARGPRCRGAQVGHAQRGRWTCSTSTSRRATSRCRAPWSSTVTETEPGRPGRHRLGRRRQAGHARVGRGACASRCS